MKFLSFIVIIFVSFSCSTQKKFQIIYDSQSQINYIADKNGNNLKSLDKKYILAFQPDKIEYFKIFSGNNHWNAIDINGNILFEIPDEDYNVPSPAYLSENRIRFIENGKVGFRNRKGKIIIPPKFEYAEQFHNGKSVIGEKCVYIEEKAESANNVNYEKHYKTECQKFGIINKRGDILKFGNFSYQQIHQ